MFEALQLSADAERIYLCLLSHPDARLAELSRRLGLDEVSVRRGLNLLAGNALVRPSWRRTAVPRAVRLRPGRSSLSAKDQAAPAARERRAVARRRRIQATPRYAQRPQTWCGQALTLPKVVVDRGEPAGSEPAGPGSAPLTPQERKLLSLLAAGSTDESAGRRLGLSARTVRRMVANLLTRLGAGSRFQAGAEAARRGWLDGMCVIGSPTR
jgi:DNA-binding NarL/FixJ family response regulator